MRPSPQALAHTHPWPEACRARARSKTKSDSSPSLSWAGFWHIPGTEKKFTPGHQAIRLGGFLKGTQFTKQNCTSCDLPSCYSPNLAQGLDIQLVFNRCSLWNPRGIRSSQCLVQGIFQIQGLNPGLPHYRILYRLNSLPGKPHPDKAHASVRAGNANSDHLI